MFGFGGNKSKSSNQSTSQSTQVGYGLNTSFSDSLSQAASQGTSQSTQNIAFEQLFNQLFGNASGAAAQAAELTPALQGQAADLFNAGGGFLEQLQGNAGTDYLTNRISSNNGLADAQIANLGTDIGDFLQNNINPTLTSNAIKAGQLGGSRQGVAQGLASQAALKQFTQGATQIRTADQAQRDAAAAQLGGLTNQGAATGLGALGSLMGIAQGGANAGLSPYAALAQIMGGPTVLTQASSQNTSESVAQAIAQALGLDYSSGQSSSQSTGSSSSWGFNIGGGK